MQVLKYTVATGYNASELEDEVEVILKAGFQPWGDLIVQGAMLLQAMVLYIPEGEGE